MALKVFHLPGAWGLISVSPFCLKLDAFLRMTGIDHESLTVAAPFRAPKGKAPWIEHDGRTIGDSTLIIAHLKATFGVDPEHALSAQQRGQAVAIQRLIEENLYWAMVHDRWIEPENWPILKRTVLSGLPGALRPVIAPLARRGVRRQIKGHGLGIHTPAEIAEIAQRDITALAAMLGDGPWFFGAEPTETDAVVYSLLANIAFTGFASAMKPMIAGHANLTAFLERFRGRYYP
jgi:glutathione S-transferase